MGFARARSDGALMRWGWLDWSVVGSWASRFESMGQQWKGGRSCLVLLYLPNPFLLMREG